MFRQTPVYPVSHVQQTLIDAVPSQKVIFQYFVCPLTELDTSLRFHTIANGNNHIKIIILDITGNRSASFFLNYRKICDSWRFCQFFLQCIIDVLTDGFDISVKQKSYLISVESYGLIFNSYV